MQNKNKTSTFPSNLLPAAEMAELSLECPFFLRLLVFIGLLGRILGQQTDPCSDETRPMVMTGYTGSFSSPNYPLVYPVRVTCSWRVMSARPGRQLWLVFDDLFNIEEYTDCNYDYLKIYDGPNDSSPLVKNLCGESAPRPINLRGNVAFVKFKSDQAITRPGFRLTWRTCPPNLLQCDEGSTCVGAADQCNMRQECQDWKDELNCNYDQACGEHISTDGPGNITTLNYPVFFPPGLSCTWSIVATQGKRLRASFTGLFDVPCPTAVNVTEVSLNGNVLNGTFTFCGSQTPPDIIVTTKERIKVNFQPPMEAPGKGFALHWETICQENYFSCPEGFCLRPEKVCDGNDDCQQGEDESYSVCSGPTTLPMMTTATDRRPGTEMTPTGNDVTPGKWSNHTTPQDSAVNQKTMVGAASTQSGLIHTPTEWKGTPKVSTATPQAWNGALGSSDATPQDWNVTLEGSDIFTTPPLDSYPRHLCYSCHDDGACARPVNSSLPVTECFDDQDCWVERILGPGKGKERIVYRRGCGSLCPDHWKQEDCTDGWIRVCRLCCNGNLCNSQLLSGDDNHFANQVSESNMAESQEPNWIPVIVASLAAVGIFTA
ncbi:tolloid-like protein 1 isoform X1 [Branchiostoma floridae]|uniref:Tolloid-like protein 1 isoform X1 n=1 Tax=Branchiostoma floridae TaxID=7739 RepID=A0A9J7MQ95_BRAFL|nr:tolloid-like protein 1 isoform X1 [Branchiostoma floridae]